ncbi:MAG: biosynthetic peptidoglycan transglycosylase [Acidimicrobiales bacterium]
MTATKTKIRRDGTVKVKKRSLLWRSRRVVFLAFLLLVAAVSGLAWVAWQIPLPSSEPPLLETTFICTSEVGDGCTADNSVAQLSGGVDRQTVRFDQIPPVLVNAVVATEDREFFKHKGVDPAGVTRAFLSNIRGDELQQGGSTITQQYVKNTYLSSERTLERKTKEAVLAIKLEKEVSKQEILERYLNTIYFGRGAYGVGAAARTYFGKDISQLGLPEASYLAGIIRAPEAADANRPATDPQAAPSRAAATTRRRQVLDAMLAEGYVTQADHDRVDGMGWEYVTPASRPGTSATSPADLGSEYVIEYVRSWLVNEAGSPTPRCSAAACGCTRPSTGRPSRRPTTRSVMCSTAPTTPRRRSSRSTATATCGPWWAGSTGPGPR